MDPLNETRNGYSLADCAEIMLCMTELKTEHGEPGYRPPFQQFLRSKGLTEDGWAHVYNDWYQVIQADPSTGAKFNAYMAQVRQRQLISKQPNVSGASMDGLSLEAYAKISAQSQSGAVIEQLVAAEGLTMEQWQRGQAAWGNRMGQCSPTDPIILQYGQLYQRWAPNHHASMEAATERILSDAAAKEGRGGGMSKALDMNNAHEFFDHQDVRVRARGAREMIRVWELGWEHRDAKMRQLTQRAFDEAVRILSQGAGADAAGLMALNQLADAVDIHTWSAMVEQEWTQQGSADLVFGPLKDLAGEQFMTPQQNNAAQDAIRQAIQRLQPREQRVQQLFSATRDELKRTQLRSLVDDYRETLSDMREALEDWSYDEPAAAPSSAAPSPVNQSLTPPAASAPADGFLAMLKALPIIGPILRALGL